MTQDKFPQVNMSQYRDKKKEEKKKILDKFGLNNDCIGQWCAGWNRSGLYVADVMERTQRNQEETVGYNLNKVAAGSYQQRHIESESASLAKYEYAYKDFDSGST